jgi:hypothetical protein
MKTAIKLLFVTVSIALITACGGGSSGGSTTVAPVASTSTFPLQTVLANYLQAQSQPYALSGVINGVAVTGSGTLTNGGLSAGNFEGASALQRTTTITGTMVGNGVNIPLNSAVVGWFNSNYLPLGSTGGTDYVVVTGTAIIPSSVRINDTATIYTATRYSDSTKLLTQGTQTFSYVVEADTSSTALLTLISISKNTFGTTTSTSSEQMRITTSGTFVRTKDTALTSAGILNITY